MNKRITIGLLLLTVIALIGIPQAFAVSDYTTDFNTKYGTSGTRGGTNLGSCITCHTGLTGGSWNNYGNDVMAQSSSLSMASRLANIETSDSDGDTFNNIVEINAGTFPGDENDHPVAVNNPPVAVSDAYTTNEDTVLTMTATNGVLSNDNDANSDTLTAIKMGDPSHGSLTLNSDGSFTYTPVAGYNGSDSFTYKANDSALDSNIAIVSITTTSVTSSLSPTDKYKVIFIVTDSMNHPVKEVRVSFKAITINTNDDGKAIFDSFVPGVYSFKVRKEGYRKITKRINMVGDTAISVKLVKSKEREEHKIESKEHKEESKEHEEESKEHEEESKEHEEEDD